MKGRNTADVIFITSAAAPGASPQVTHTAPCRLLPQDKWSGERRMHQHIKSQKRQKAGLNHTRCNAEIFRLTVHKLLLDSPETLTSLLLIRLFLISALMQLYSLGDLLWWGHPVHLWQQLREGPALSQVSQEMCPSK